METIAEMVSRLARERAELKEIMAETMLTDPRGWGILVIEQDQVVSVEDVLREDRTLSLQIQWRLDPDVPFGRIYQFSSEAGVLAWRDRGAPGPGKG